MSEPGESLPGDLAEDELPVVARLVIEIRSDGARTVARGALEERTLGQQVALEARAGTPEELTLQLVKALLSTPLLAGGAMRAAVGQRLRAASRRLLPRGIRGLLPGSAAGEPPGPKAPP